MKRYILTGTPGSGKTSIIRALEIRGHFVINEAATDIIAHEQALGISEPWRQPSFINKVVALQKQRQLQISELSLQFYDRSPICIYALSIFLEYEPSTTLLREIKRIK